MRAHEPSALRETRIVPPRRTTTNAMIVPAAMKRVETASRGGSVSTAILIPRYVEPQVM